MVQASETVSAASRHSIQPTSHNLQILLLKEFMFSFREPLASLLQCAARLQPPKQPRKAAMVSIIRPFHSTETPATCFALGVHHQLCLIDWLYFQTIWLLSRSAKGSLLWSVEAPLQMMRMMTTRHTWGRHKSACQRCKLRSLQACPSAQEASTWVQWSPRTSRQRQETTASSRTTLTLRPPTMGLIGVSSAASTAIDHRLPTLHTSVLCLSKCRDS